jgi:hypothetical protein
MNTQKERLKSLLQQSPREKRVEMEEFIDNNILDKHVRNALSYYDKATKGATVNFSISDLGYGIDDFYITVSTGMSYMT